jgi:hypothetical protein
LRESNRVLDPESQVTRTPFSEQCTARELRPTAFFDMYIGGDDFFYNSEDPDYLETDTQATGHKATIPSHIFICDFFCRSEAYHSSP